MFISAIMPSHILDDKFKKSLESLITQDYGNYEIIVVSDNNQELIDYVNQNYSMVKTYNTFYDGMGVAKARNIGADNAKGELLVFIDSDCICPPNLLTKYYENYTPLCLLVGGIIHWDIINNKIIHEEYRSVFNIDKYNPSPNKWWWNHDTWGEHHILDFYTANVGVCKYSFDEIGGFDEELKGLEDMYFALEHYSLFEKIKFIDTYVKHLHEPINWRLDSNIYDWKVYYNKVINNYPHFADNEHFKKFIQMLEEGKI